MTRRTLIRRIRARLDGERGFTILETVIAIMVVFASLTALAYTASIGFRYVGYGRDRIQATGVANRVMEDIRGLAYTKITNGIPSNELASDSRIVSCSGTYRFETCSGEKIVSSTFAPSYEAAWLVPHTDQLSVGNLDFTYHTYVTNDSPTTTPYRVTVIIEWANGAIRSAPNNSVRLQSLFWSPNGCVNPNTHPFAAPCQPFFYAPGRRAPGAAGRHGPAARLRGRLRLPRAHAPRPLRGRPGGADDAAQRRHDALRHRVRRQHGDHGRRQPAGVVGGRRRGGDERGIGERGEQPRTCRPVRPPA